MEINKRILNDTSAVIELKGSLLSDTEGQALFALGEKILAEGNKNIILDLTQLKHVNSSGLGIFIRLLTRTRNLGGDVVICGINQGVSNLFTITKLHTIFRFAPTAEEALVLFKE